ncbi:MAG: copper oxidase, partial [Candidatus Methylumidiphilus sp.]
KNTLSALALGLALAQASYAAQDPKIIDHNQLMDHGDGHLMDMDGGMIMGQNKDKLPAGCDKVAEDVKIEVHAGRKYSKQFPGTIFGFDKHEWRVKPCTRLTVTFVNEDNVRHQWMMHGLPKFMYDKGMFHLEITGPAKVTGTLILPAEDKTYLVHCDIAQHMEKGMKGQLIVGKGSGTFPTIPGITDPAIPDNYGQAGSQQQPSAAANTNTPATQSASSGQVAAEAPSGLASISLIVGLTLGFIGAPFLFRWIEERCKGMTAADGLKCAVRFMGDAFNSVMKLLAWVYKWIVAGKGKLLLPKDK